MRPDRPPELIGVDVGAARVGLARASSAARLAEPLKTVTAAAAIDEIARLDPDMIIIGLPRNLDGDETAQTDYVKRWAESARKQIDKPFYWQDEALTSRAAETSEHAAGPDAVAAAVILQDFLDTPEDQRVRC